MCVFIRVLGVVYVVPHCTDSVYLGCLLSSCEVSCTLCVNAQIWILEKNGGSLVGGALQLFQERRKNPPPPRDPRLPPKPKVRCAHLRHGRHA